MKLKVTKPFDFAHRGCEVKRYAKGEEIDTDTADPELVKVVTDEGWAAKARAKAEGQGGKEPADPLPGDPPSSDEPDPLPGDPPSSDEPDPAPPEDPAPQP